MSDVSIRASIYSCNHPLVQTGDAGRLQSARTFDPALNVVSNLYKDANDPYSGRPSSHNAMNGVYGTASLGMAGLNAESQIALTTGLRQVEFQSQYPHTTFYDTLAGANRSNWYTQFAGKTGTTCAVMNGPTAYTSTPQQNTCGGNGVGLTSVDRRNYLAALQQAYNDQGLF